MLQLLWSSISLTTAGGSFVQPLDLAFGDSCSRIYSHYETEKVHSKNDVETHVLQDPQVAFPSASRIVIGCEGGVFQSLVIIAETDRESSQPSVVSQLEAQFGKRYECPQNEDETVLCAIFQKERIVAIYNSDISQIGEYAIVYAYQKDARDIAEKLKGVRSDG